MKGRIDFAPDQGRRAVVLVEVLLTAIMVSCSSQSAPRGIDAALGRLGQVSYVFLQWEHDGSLMIWHDMLESSMEEGPGATSDPVRSFYGHAESVDGRRFDWRLQTTDGHAAKFMIDDTNYHLSAGTLFIVSTRKGKTSVKQLARDLSSVRPSRESCLGFALRDQDIASFVLIG